MAIIISAIIALTLLIAYKKFDNDPMLGMASVLFWVVFAGASFLNSSGGDLSNIYFYLFFAGVVFCFAVLLDVLNVSPFKAMRKEQIEEKQLKKGTVIDEMREQRGMRPPGGR